MLANHLFRGIYMHVHYSFPRQEAEQTNHALGQGWIVLIHVVQLDDSVHEAGI